MNKLPHPAPLSEASYSAVELAPENDRLWILDQRRLPDAEEYCEVRTVEQVRTAISEMWVRGAPAIGIAGAYGCVLAAAEAGSEAEFEELLERIASARPTAVNLRWAVERMREAVALEGAETRVTRVLGLAEAARTLHRRDVAANRVLGHLGAACFGSSATVLTHCNAGALATGGFGTALGVIRALREQNKQVRIFADETRPWLQGARLTAWELSRDGFEVTVIADGAAASLMRTGRIDGVVVGADRIARSGDVANKIGTYHLACAAHQHEVPFYVAAPFSTVDLDTPSGERIVIEERPSSEVTHLGGQRIVPDGVRVFNPSFDVTDARLVRALFTERGLARPLTEAELLRLSRVHPNALPSGSCQNPSS